MSLCTWTEVGDWLSANTLQGIRIEDVVVRDRYDELRSMMHEVCIEREGYGITTATFVAIHEHPVEKGRFIGVEPNGALKSMWAQGWKAHGCISRVRSELHEAPQLLSDKEIEEYMILVSKMEEVKERLKAADMPYWAETSAFETRRMAAMEQRRTDSSQEELIIRGLYTEEEKEEDDESFSWTKEDGYDSVTGLGRKIGLNFWRKTREGWKKQTFFYVSPWFSGNPRIVPADNAQSLCNRLKAYCRDEAWDLQPTIGESLAMKRLDLTKPWATVKCNSDKCGGRKTRHYVSEYFVSCLTKGCNWRQDRKWVSVGFKPNRLPEISSNLVSDLVTDLVTVYLMGVKAREIISREEGVEII